MNNIRRKKLCKKIFLGTLLAICTLFLPYFFVTLLHRMQSNDVSNKVKVTDSDIIIAINKSDDEKDIQYIDCEEYIKGALSCEAKQIEDEFDFSMNDETLKALAIVIRTHVHKIYEDVDKNIIFSSECGYDYTPDYNSKCSNAVKSTDKTIILYNSKPVECFYCLSSCGMTRDGAYELGNEDYSYLKSVDAKKDYNSPGFLTLCYYKNNEFRDIISSKLDITLNDTFTASDFDTSDSADSGYIKKLTVSSSSIANYDNPESTNSESQNANSSEMHNLVIDAKDFANVFNLPSTCFYLEDFNGGIRIVSKGKGHGFGMSLYTAEMMAKDGKNFEDILRYFYQDIILEKN